MTLPDGRTLRDALRTDGPAQHGVWFEQMPDTGGSQWTDILWDTSACGIKVVTEHLAACLRGLDPSIELTPALVKDRHGTPQTGYMALMESIGTTTPIHSYKERARGSKVVVSADVAAELRSAGFTGLEFLPTGSVFPGDEPLE